MKTISKIYNSAAKDSLYRNSIFLMASTAVMAILGFFFWLINARLFTPEQVGIGTTLISVMALISSFSILGLGNSLIKYLPSSERKNEKINTSFTLVGLASLTISVIFLLFVKTFSPSLIFVKENPIFAFLFVLFIVFSTLNALSESVFIAYRSSKYVLIKNTVWGLVKLSLPFVLLTLGAYGIFMSVGISAAIASILCLLLLIWKFKFIFKPVINTSIVKRMFRFSMGNYLAGFIGGFPAMVLPILITNSIGPKFSAYFYMDMMIANFLYVVPMAVSQSLFAEGSYSETELKVNLKKAVKIISLILIPGILATVFFGKYILLAFGKEYSSEGIIFLQLLAISSVFVAINYIGNSLLYIKHRVKLIILVNLVGTTTILLLSSLLGNQNLLGIGTAWIIGQGLVSVICLVLIRKLHN